MNKVKGSECGMAAAREISVKWSGFGGNLVASVAALHAGGAAGERLAGERPAGERLADVRLVAGGRSFPAHRLVLAACSDTFRHIFQGTETARGVTRGGDCVVVLHEMPAECVRALLTFMYQGEVCVTEEFLPRLVRAAEELGVHGLSAPRSDPARTATPPRNHLPLKASTSSLKKRKRETEPRPWNKDTQQDTPPINDTIVPKTEPIDPITCDYSSENTNDTDIALLDETISKKQENNSDESDCSNSANGAKRRAREASGAGGGGGGAEVNAADIEREIEDVLQSGTVVETLGVDHATPGGHSNVTGDPGGGSTCAYASPSFPCPFCPRVYNSWGYRRRHVKSRHLTNRLSCKWCVCVLESTGAWYGHATRAHGVPHQEARNSLVIMVEAHAVLTTLASPHRQPSAEQLLHQLPDVAQQHTA